MLEEDDTTVTKLLSVLLVPKGLKIVICLFVGYPLFYPRDGYMAVGSFLFL